MFEETFKNFNINLNNRNTFSSGDVVTGQISFELTKEIKITSITIAMTGRADVHWSSGGGGGRKRKRRRRHFSAKVEFFKLQTVVMQENNGVTWFLSHIYAILNFKEKKEALQQNSLRNNTVLYNVMRDFPSSFHGVHGKIVYSLTVGIRRPWHLSKDFVTELNFVKHINTNHPDMWSPLSGSNQMTTCCLWCASRPVTITASVEKKAFMPGETLKMICQFSNGSSQTATPKVRLQQRQSFYTQNKVNKRTVYKYLESVTGQPLEGHASDVHTEITLTIPPSASFTISNCNILEVDYLVEVILSGWAIPELKVLFPIIVCDTPVHAHPLPYL